MPIADWSSSTIGLGTTYGQSPPAIPFNAAVAPGGGVDRYLLDKSGCDMWQELRATSMNVPQEDGSLQFERFTSGTFIKLKVELWHDADPACDADLVRMVDTLSMNVNSLVKTAMAGRFYWTPAGGAQRMQDYVRLASRIQWDWSGLVVSAEFTLDSPYPYAIDANQNKTTITGSTVLSNTGTSTMYPVFQVSGTDAFMLSNDTTGYAVVYSNSFPGTRPISDGGSKPYLEIDMFRNVAYIGGDIYNGKKGIDVMSTDFFGLVPGNNVISIDAGSADALWAPAWS